MASGRGSGVVPGSASMRETQAWTPGHLARSKPPSSAAWVYAPTRLSGRLGADNSRFMHGEQM